MMSAFYAKNYIKAQFYANKILQSGEKSIYTDAAQFHYAVCTMNIPEAKKSSKVSAGIKTAEAELKKFIKDKPYGDYRGDAIMCLGAMELEQNFNTKVSAKYYEEALAWFKYQRELKNATDLFVIPDKVKEISKPKGKNASLDEWNRVVYRTPSPLEIITPKSAPWCLDENEQEALFMVGLCLFLDARFAEAGECWKQTSSLDKDIAFLEQKGIPNYLARMRAACKQGYIIASPNEMKAFKGENKLKIILGDFKYILSKFPEAAKLYESVAKSSGCSDKEKAYALVGLGNCLMMQERSNEALKIYLKVFSNDKTEKSVAAANAMKNYAMLLYYSANIEDNKKALIYFEKCHKKYPDTVYGEEALCMLAVIGYVKGEKEGDRYLRKYQETYPKGKHADTIKEYGKVQKEIKEKMANEKKTATAR